MSVDPTQIVTFDKSIILSYLEGGNQTSNGTIGQLRFNQSTLKFEGYHGSNGALLGEIWRPLTQDIASASNLGVIKVGTNLNINPSTGVLSSIAAGVSRFNQLVITVSPILGAADYQTINEAITSAIGTPSGGYLDGILTSNLGSAPSPTYPFVIQLGPGQYSEPLNQITLPDYVSLFGESNYNSIITLNTGNISIATGSMIIVGQNASINNLVINIDDVSTSNIVNGLYISNKSNVVIDNCIFTTTPECNTTEEMYFIWMADSSNTNRITNCRFNINSPLITSNVSAICIQNTAPFIQNNKVDINTSNTSYNTAIKLVDCSGLPSNGDIPILDNIQIYNNFENITSGCSNYGIHIINSSAVITNSIIECNNDQSISNNYGVILESATPLITTTSANVLDFTHYTATGQLDRITSNNTGVVNFTTLGFLRGQYITISGSGLNDGLYKIANVVSNSVLELEDKYRLSTEGISSNSITLEALYKLDVEKSSITGSTNSIWNNDSNSNYLVNLANNIIQGDVNITPSRILYTRYKTITVGKENCDYTLLSTALADITDNSENNQYLISINSGLYQEQEYISCKPYVNIDGNGIQNTTLQFYQAEDSYVPSKGSPTSNSSCLLLASYSRVSNFKIVNSSVLNTSNATTSVLYVADPINPIEQVHLDNLEIASICGSVFNYGIYLSNASNITLSSVNITVQSNDNTTTTPVLNSGLMVISGSDIICNDVNVIADSGITNENTGMIIVDSNATLNNITCVVNSGINQNIGIKTYNTTMNEKLIEIFNGIINTSDNVEYSIFANDYYTIVCNGVNLIGDTYTSPVSSRIICNGCYTFTSSQYNTSYQSLNSRGQNEQALGTITIGDSAGKLNSTGINDTFIGVNSGSSITTGSYNTGIGNNAGASITTSEHNTVIGNNAGAVLDNSYNTIVGSNAGALLASGVENTLIGYNCANKLLNGSLNVIVGSNVGINMSSGSNNNVLIGEASFNSYSNISIGNTTLGWETGALTESGNFNVFIGSESGKNSNGNNNVFIGAESGFFNTSSNIIAIGTSAGFNNGLGVQNTYLGFQSGYNTTGNCNTLIGNNAGYSNANALASYNTVIGTEAGYSLNTGSRNVLVGSVSGSGTSDAPGWNLENGNDNILIGVKAGSSATNAINNVILGSNVGSSITTGSNNILIGKDTATSLTTAGQSVIIGGGAGVNNTVGNALIIGHNAGVKNISMGAYAIGYSAGSNVSGDFNMFMGYNSGGLPKLNTTGAYNIAIGPYTGYNLTSGTRNVIVGSGDSIESAGRLISTGSDNTLMGFKAGRAIQLGSGNTLIGSNAGANLTNGLDNLLLGYKSGFSLNTGSYNVVLGPEAGYNLNTGGYNIYAGYQSAYNNQSGSYNINVGYKTGFTSTTNANNIHIGYEAGYDSIANDNIFIGTSTGVQNTTGTNNIFVGQNAGYGNNPNNQQIGDDNIFMGTSAGNANDNGYRNIFLGYQSGKASIGGSKNVFIGENTGSTGSTSHNIFIGSARDDDKGIGYLADSSGEYNVFVGHDVGIANTTGDHNIFLGDSAGKNNTTGTQNIYIGTNAGRDASASTADNNIAMGTDAGLLNQSGQENILIGKRVAGLSTSTDYNQNIIIGSEAGQNIQQDNQIFIGTNAGKNNTTGDRNIFIGLNAGTANVDSQDNVIIGSEAGASLVGTSGLGDNVIIGSQAGHDLETGINNIFIGSNSGANAINAQNCVVIGANSMSVGDASNVIIMGNDAGKLNNADFNICIGYQAGKNNAIGISNIIMGASALPNGEVAANNVIIGTDACKYIDSPLEFVNNLVLGRLAGQYSNVASGSLIMGTNAGGVGSGGTNNILMGYQVANNLGTLYFKADTSSIMNVNDNYVNINLPYGSATYYFKFGDLARIYNPATISTTQDFAIGFITAIIEIDATTTQIVLDNVSSVNLPIGSIMYKVNSNIEFAGIDTSKSSANICMGFNTGYNLSDGSKNAAIGDEAMYNNKVGKNNVAFGSKAGYTLNTNNNLCLGTNAGYSLDQYVNSNSSLDMTFYSANNTVVFNSGAPGVYPYGSVFEIIGSSSNDGRYNVNNSTSNSIVVQGFPNIQENGLPVSLYPDDYKINVQDFQFINYNTTITSGEFDNATSILRIGYPSSGDALDAYTSISNATFFKITNSLYNDGIHSLDAINQTGSNVYITSNTGIFSESISTSVDFTIRNIVCTTSPQYPNFGFQDIYPNNIFYLQFGSEKGTYTINPDVRTITSCTSIYINGTYVNENIDNITIQNNILYTDGAVENITPSSFATLYYYSYSAVQFSKSNNRIYMPYTAIFVLTGDRLYKILGTQYNNGYFYVNSTFLTPTTYIWELSPSTPIKADETVPTNTFFEIMPINFNLFSNIFNNSVNWNGKILNVDYKVPNPSSDEDFEYHGAYVLENIYNGAIGLNDAIINTYITTKNTKNRRLALSGNGTELSSAAFESYISGADLIYQNSNITLSATIYTSNNTITTSVEWGFVDFIAPVVIKIENSANGNDGYYLVKANHHPYNTMVINGTFPGSDETNTITLKQNSISTMLNSSNLAVLDSNQQYVIYGSKYNDGVKITPVTNAIFSSSVYCTDDVQLQNDVSSDYDMYIAKTDNYSNYLPNIGKFIHFEYTGVSISFITMNRFDIPDTIGSNLYNSLSSIGFGHYLKITNSTNNNNGLYEISSINYGGFVPNTWSITVLNNYVLNGTVYITNFNIGTGGTLDLACNEYVNNSTNPSYLNQLDFKKFIQNVGTNGKFLSFQAQSTYLYLTIVSTNYITFELENYPLLVSGLGTGNIIYLTETCSNETTETVHYITFGEPNPSTIRTSDIQRQKRRPYFFSDTTLQYYGIDCDATLNTITIHTPLTVSIPYVQNPYYYGKPVSPYNFASLQENEIFYYSFDGINGNWAEITSISDNKLTLTINPIFPGFTTGYKSKMYIYKYITLNSDRVDFKQFTDPGIISYINYKFIRRDRSSASQLNLRIYQDTNYIDFTSNPTTKNYLGFKTSTFIPSSYISNTTTTNIHFAKRHSIIVPNQYLTTTYTNLFFHNTSITGSGDITFYSSNNTIHSTTTDLSSFIAGEYIQISGTTNNNYLYRIDQTSIPSTTLLTLSSIGNDRTVSNEINTNATILANCINTNDILSTSLNIFGGGQKILVSKTEYNNTTYTSNIASNSAYSIFIESNSVITEYPRYCTIEKSAFIDEETTYYGSGDIDFYNSNNTIYTSNTAIGFDKFNPNQNITITNTTLNNTSTEITDTIPTDTSIITNATLVDEVNTSAIITKNITFTLIGEPVQAAVSSSYTELYHYEDAEGNNAMIGSYAGQYVGALNNAIYNVAIGSRCGQVNHGSGNIFIGNESRLATSATDSATTYSNKFAIYKNNFIGVPANPIIGGDFTSGRVGINTINPESYNYNYYNEITVTDTKLVVNGGAIANSFSPFTGCHLVFLDNSNSSNSNVVILPGMIMSATGKVEKVMIINTFVSVIPSSKLNDKKVFGVYAYSEQSKKTTQPEYIINDNGQYSKNPLYITEMITLNYVASIGEGQILITNITGDIQNGDYITSSEIPGYGCLQSDDLMHSYTVAKCTEDVDWLSIPENILCPIDGKMYKSVMVACTYHCG